MHRSLPVVEMINALAKLTPLAAADPIAIETLLDAAFGSDRRGRTAYRLREGMDAIPTLSFATFDEGGALVGSLQSWPIELNPVSGAAAPLVLVGPVAVRPDRQRDGIGRRMMEHMLEAADDGAADALLLIGDPEYYGRFFGFSADLTSGWEVPGPVDRHRLLARTKPGLMLPRVGMLGPRRAEVVSRAA